MAAFGTGHEAFIKAGCPMSDCEIVANSTAFWSSAIASLNTSSGGELASFDAIIINMHELWLSFMPSALKNYRRPARQRLIWLTQESPTTMPINPTQFAGVFNWTMSYKVDPCHIRLKT